jgi:hypothetical protein
MRYRYLGSMALFFQLSLPLQGKFNLIISLQSLLIASGSSDHCVYLYDAGSLKVPNFSIAEGRRRNAINILM